VSDVNAVVQAAIGGQAVTQVYEGERLFDLVVRFLPEYRQDVEAISNILVSTPDGARIPLKQLATIATQTGAFIIYRENNERYIPIKFSVRDRDLESTVEEAQALLAKTITLPERYRMEWAGQYDQLKDEQKRLATIVPVSLLLILRFAEECSAGAVGRPVCADWRRDRAGGDAHEFQHFGGSGHYFHARRGHLGGSSADLAD
jgi:cobalt-zinc-cadmium resistance protein CzcA